MIYDGSTLGVAGNSCQLPSSFLKAKLGKPPGWHWEKQIISLLFSLSPPTARAKRIPQHTWVELMLDLTQCRVFESLAADRLLLRIQMLTAVSNCKWSKTPSWQSEKVPGPTDPLRTDKYFNKNSTWGDRLWAWMWLFPTFGDLVILLLLQGWLLFFDWLLFPPYLHPHSQASKTPPTLPADQNSPLGSKRQDRLPLQRCSSPVVCKSCGTPQTCSMFCQGPQLASIPKFWRAMACDTSQRRLF